MSQVQDWASQEKMMNLVSQMKHESFAMSSESCPSAVVRRQWRWNCPCAPSGGLETVSCVCMVVDRCPLSVTGVGISLRSNFSVLDFPGNLASCGMLVPFPRNMGSPSALLRTNPPVPDPRSKSWKIETPPPGRSEKRHHHGISCGHGFP